MAMNLRPGKPATNGAKSGSTKFTKTAPHSVEASSPRRPAQHAASKGAIEAERLRDTELSDSGQAAADFKPKLAAWRRSFALLEPGPLALLAFSAGSTVSAQRTAVAGAQHPRTDDTNSRRVGSLETGSGGTSSSSSASSRW